MKGMIKWCGGAYMRIRNRRETWGAKEDERMIKIECCSCLNDEMKTCLYRHRIISLKENRAKSHYNILMMGHSNMN